MAEQIGTMPCDTKGCGEFMTVMQDKRKKFYTVCKCGRNTRNTNFGQEIFKQQWTEYCKTVQNIPEESDVILGEPLENEPEILESEALEVSEKPSTSKGKKILTALLYVGAAIGGWKLYDRAKN